MALGAGVKVVPEGADEQACDPGEVDAAEGACQGPVSRVLLMKGSSMAIDLPRFDAYPILVATDDSSHLRLQLHACWPPCPRFGYCAMRSTWHGNSMGVLVSLVSVVSSGSSSRAARVTYSAS